MTGKKLTPEEVARAKVAAEQQARAWAVFLEYHENSPWAEAKAAAGGWLSPEVIAYMEREVAGRKHALEEFEKRDKAEKEKFDAANDKPAPAAHGGGSSVSVSNGHGSSGAGGNATAGGRLDGDQSESSPRAGEQNN